MDSTCTADQTGALNVVDEAKSEDPENCTPAITLHSTQAQITRPRSERWNIIARALRGLKTKIQHGAEGRDCPYIDETDDGAVSVSAESSVEGASTHGNMSPKESVDLTDGEDLAEADKETAGVGVSDVNNITETTSVLTRNLEPQPQVTREDEFKSRSTGSSDATTTTGLSEALKNSLVIMLSAIYGIIIVVMGLVLPLAEIFASSEHPYFFEVFYLYLYSVSMAFLIYVYTYLLRNERLFRLSFPRTVSRTLSRTLSRTSLRSQRSSTVSEKGENQAMKPLVRYNSTMSFISQKRRRKIAYNPEISAHTGSFYLRVGVIGFGIGSMIHSALTFGHYFEVNHFANHCSDAVQAVKPFTLLCFTFVQMYFIFMNSKMCVHKYKTLARFGLMHMSCTNVCIWLRSIVLQTLFVMKFSQRDADGSRVQTKEEVQKVVDISSPQTGLTSEEISSEDEIGFVSEISCNLDAMMGKVVENSSIYLYPCTIEYSLVCACVLYVMWTNVGEGGTSTRAESCIDLGIVDSEDDSDEDNGNHRMSVDCASSSRGLFLGILLFVIVVVCIVCFHVLTSASSHVTAGTLLGHISEEIILVITFVATVIASFQMREMHFSAQHEVGIEETLTLISISGLGLYGGWSIVAAIFHLDTLHGRLTIITNLFMLIQAGSQATFTMLALRASARNNEQLRSKPGRECVTFLLIGNFALWVINTFETQRLEYSQTQVDFYGSTAWSIFSHISVPLGIYFRFHSTVNLSIVWKKAWKKKETRRKVKKHSHISK